jgi:hypothetical protein
MSKKETAPLAPELNELVRTIADRAKPHMVVKEGGIVEAKKTQYEEDLEPTGLTIEQARKLQDHNSVWRAGMALAFGEVSADALKANPDLASTSMDMRAGHDRYDLSLNREGVLDGRWQVKGIGSAGSHYGKVAAHLSNLVKSTLS